MEITYAKLTPENFSPHSLDRFIRLQEVKECWRNVEGELTLVPCAFTEDWDLVKRREIAAEILEGLRTGFSFGAFSQGEVVGYILVDGALFGGRSQYAELKLFHVSQPFRRMGIGKELFRLACEGAKSIGAEKLYISAHSSKESIAAYHRLGCTQAQEINERIAQSEPFDLQLEYCL